MLRSSASLIALCLLVGGCASKSKALKGSTFVFQPSAGNGVIVLYRNTAGYMGMGGGVNSTLTINNKPLGDLTQDRYAVIDVPPGEHMVNLMGVSGVSNVMITVAPGEVRFIQVTTWPSLGTTQTQREQAMSDLDNDGEPLVLGFKYSFAGAAAPLAKDPNTTNL